MAISKLILDNQVQMDVTQITATPADVASGKTFIQADGTVGTGTASGVSIDDIATDTAPSGAITLSNSVTRIRDYAFAFKPITSISAPKVTEIDGYAFTNTGLLDISPTTFPLLTTVGISAFQDIKTVKRIYITSLSNIGKLYICRGCTDLKVLRFPNATSSANQYCASNSNLLIADMGGITSINSNGFNGCSSLTTLILRGTSRATLSNVSAFNNTPFKSGGTGGTIYIPKALYDHLGDGTSSDYQSATNWATVYGYGTITWAKIEGSPYEDKDWDDSGFLT